MTVSTPNHAQTHLHQDHNSPNGELLFNLTDLDPCGFTSRHRPRALLAGYWINLGVYGLLS